MATAAEQDEGENGKIATGNDPAAAGRETRSRMLLRARMFSDSMPEQDILIRNASLKGIGAVASRRAPQLEEAVYLVLPDGEELLGMVRWVDGKIFGVELDEAIDMSLLKSTTQHRNEEIAKAIDWMVEMHFNPPKQEDAAEQDPESLRPV